MPVMAPARNAMSSAGARPAGRPPRCARWRAPTRSCRCSRRRRRASRRSGSRSRRGAQEEPEQDEDHDADDGDRPVLAVEIGLAPSWTAPAISCIRAVPAASARTCCRGQDAIGEPDAAADQDQHVEKPDRTPVICPRTPQHDNARHAAGRAGQNLEDAPHADKAPARGAAGRRRCRPALALSARGLRTRA